MIERLESDTIVDGRYRVERRLGSGGMADVYLAVDQQLGRRVALKLLYRRFAEDPEFVERFRREASAAAGLQHQHVVSVYDRGAWEGTFYIAMEYLEGRSLKALIAQHAPLEPDDRDRLRGADPQRRALRAPPRRDPPRPQAAQRDRRRRGRPEGHRLRDRARRSLGHDADRVDHGHRAVPVAGAGAGPRREPAVRPVLDRHRALRDANRAACRSRATARWRSRSSRSARRPCRRAPTTRPSRRSSSRSSCARSTKDPVARFADAESFSAALESARAGLAMAGARRAADRRDDARACGR